MLLSLYSWGIQITILMTFVAMIFVFGFLVGLENRNFFTLNAVTDPDAGVILLLALWSGNFVKIKNYQKLERRKLKIFIESLFVVLILGFYWVALTSYKRIREDIEGELERSSWNVAFVPPPVTENKYTNFT